MSEVPVIITYSDDVIEERLPTWLRGCIAAYRQTGTPAHLTWMATTLWAETPDKQERQRRA